MEVKEMSNSELEQLLMKIASEIHSRRESDIDSDTKVGINLAATAIKMYTN